MMGVRKDAIENERTSLLRRQGHQHSAQQYTTFRFVDDEEIEEVEEVEEVQKDRPVTRTTSIQSVFPVLLLGMYYKSSLQVDAVD